MKTILKKNRSHYNAGHYDRGGGVPELLGKPLDAGGGGSGLCHGRERTGADQMWLPEMRRSVTRQLRMTRRFLTCQKKIWPLPGRFSRMRWRRMRIRRMCPGKQC